MKRIRLLQWVFFVGISCFLIGCPIPNQYRIFIDKGSNKLIFNNTISTELYYHKILVANPWLDTRKKIIIINSSVNNKSKENLVIDFNSVQLKSKKDVFSLMTEDLNLKNPFKIDSTSLTVKPNETSVFALYFISKGYYTKRDYKRSLKNDTLLLNVEILKEKETFYLIQ